MAIVDDMLIYKNFQQLRDEGKRLVEEDFYKLVKKLLLSDLMAQDHRPPSVGPACFSAQIGQSNACLKHEFGLGLTMTDEWV